MVVRHNHLRDVFVDFCQQAHLSVSVEKGHGLTRDHSHTRPLDMLIAHAGWDRGKPAAFDVTVTSPLCPAIQRESCRSTGAASTARDLQATLQRSQMSGIEVDVVIHHNRLWDEIFDICRRAHLSVSVERGHGLTRDLAPHQTCTR